MNMETGETKIIYRWFEDVTKVLDRKEFSICKMAKLLNKTFPLVENNFFEKVLLYQIKSEIMKFVSYFVI